jgi:hypothetical protein
MSVKIARYLQVSGKSTCGVVWGCVGLNLEPGWINILKEYCP